MSRRASHESGYTLPEVLIGAALTVVLVSAALMTFDVFQRTTTRNARQNDAQEVARATLLRLSRQLRNIAGPVEGQPQSFDAIGPYNLVFKAVNPSPPASQGNPANIERIRYCLDGGAGTGAPQRLWMQEQIWTASIPPAYTGSSTCPDSSWGNPRVVAEHVVNNLGGQGRPVFTFNSADPPAVTEVNAELFVDRDPAHDPPETRLATGVYLRNQNRSPVAQFQATPGTKHVILNASASSDPEGQLLSYSWTDGSTQLQNTAAVWDYQTTGGAHTIQLRVTDPGGLSVTHTETVQVPG
jgi:type II secretory pathway pseudopilin PulG